MTALPNPLLNGFHPDPSVVEVDGVFYLATSTFEYLPGIPIYHSRDFVTWTQVGNVATRVGQLDVEKVPTAGGAWAPTIRHRDGVFHLVVTDAFGRGTLHFTATDPAGPWSDGVVLEGIDGIDPDLVWDDEGTAYLTFSGLGVNPALIGIILGIDRILDMCRTTLNVTGDITAAAYVARSEGFPLIDEAPAEG